LFNTTLSQIARKHGNETNLKIEMPGVSVNVQGLILWNCKIPSITSVKNSDGDIRVLSSRKTKI
jgi:hypothetical protein